MLAILRVGMRYWVVC